MVYCLLFWLFINCVKNDGLDRFRVHVETAEVEVGGSVARRKRSRLRKPRPVYLIHWMRALTPSARALVTVVDGVDEETVETSLDHPGNLAHRFELRSDGPVVPAQ